MPIAKTTVLQRYSPSEVVNTKSSAARAVDSHRQPYRATIFARSAKATRPFSISGRDGK